MREKQSDIASVLIILQYVLKSAGAPLRNPLIILDYADFDVISRALFLPGNEIKYAGFTIRPRNNPRFV
jgi:hypothetical protein